MRESVWVQTWNFWWHLHLGVPCSCSVPVHLWMHLLLLRDVCLKGAQQNQMVAWPGSSLQHVGPGKSTEKPRALTPTAMQTHHLPAQLSSAHLLAKQGPCR